MGQSLLAAYATFCMNDRFDYLSSRTMLEGREVRRYRPFDDVPVEGKFDWEGFAWNLLYGVMVTAVLAVAVVATGCAALFVGAAVAACGTESWSIGVRSQKVLESYAASLNEAMSVLSVKTPGRYFGTYGNWELGINTQTRVVYHAKMLY